MYCIEFCIVLLEIVCYSVDAIVFTLFSSVLHCIVLCWLVTEVIIFFWLWSFWLTQVGSSVLLLVQRWLITGFYEDSNSIFQTSHAFTIGKNVCLYKTMKLGMHYLCIVSCDHMNVEYRTVLYCTIVSILSYKLTTSTFLGL